MPIEDWIEKWTDMQVREMTNLEERHRRTTDSLAESLKRMEDRHEARMQKIENSIEEMKRSNSEEFGKVYDKLDLVYSKLDELIRTTNDKQNDSLKQTSLDLVELKVKIGIIAAAIAISAAALASWLTKFLG